MKISIYVFSGTGNTLRVCELLSEYLKKGNDVNLNKIVKGVPLRGECECIVIGYPVHAFNAPAPVIDFLKRMPDTERKIPVCFIQTSGEPLGFNNAAYLRPRRIVEKKGYRFMSMFSYVMPYNIIFRHSDAMAARMWNVVKTRITSDSEKISGNEMNACHVSLTQRFVSFILRIEHAAMPVAGRYFKTTDRCIGCGLCSQICPQKNITMKDGKPLFGKNCIACMGCAFHCPKDAVRTSLLNAWRVNGRYDWNTAPAKDNEVCRYCRKSYLGYFHEYEQ